MDARIQTGGARTDVTLTDTAPRVTPPAGAPFAEVVGRSAGAIARGAEAAVTSLPGAPVVAAAIRGGAPVTPAAPRALAASGSVLLSGAAPTLTAAGGATATTAAEGPGAASAGAAPGASVEQTLAQSQDLNLYYLQLQEQMSAENRSYTAMSNVLKARHDTVKNAIGNIR